MTEPQTLTVAELADLAGCSPMTVRRHCARGYVPGADKPGRDWVIPMEGAQHYLKHYSPYDGLRTTGGGAGASHNPDPA